MRESYRPRVRTIQLLWLSVSGIFFLDRLSRESGQDLLDCFDEVGRGGFISNVVVMQVDPIPIPAAEEGCPAIFDRVPTVFEGEVVDLTQIRVFESDGGEIGFGVEFRWGELEDNGRAAADDGRIGVDVLFGKIDDFLRVIPGLQGNDQPPDEFVSLTRKNHTDKFLGPFEEEVRDELMRQPVVVQAGFAFPFVRKN